MGKQDFQNLYIKLKGLSPNESMNKIDYIFEQFDTDKNGWFNSLINKKILFIWNFITGNLGPRDDQSKT